VKDYYSTLGVARAATPDEIKKAYRKLASQHHPDKGGDTAKFQEIEEAYRVLSDPDQRAAHDNPRPDFGGFGFRQAGQPFDFDSIFNMFGTQFHQQRPQRQATARMTLWLQLSDIAQGGRKTVSVGTSVGAQVIEVDIPVGIEDGASVMYPGLAPGGVDLAITFRIHPNPRWQRDGFNLYTDHKLSIWTMITGGDIVVRDILNQELTVAIPPMTQPGQILRCRSRGLKDRASNPGDMMIRIQAEIPKSIPEDLLARIRQETGR
jgi:curved DNA-binding protein